MNANAYIAGSASYGFSVWSEFTCLLSGVSYETARSCADDCNRDIHALIYYLKNAFKSDAGVSFYEADETLFPPDAQRKEANICLC